MPDVVVVGAGPVGLLLSAELARRGLDVLTLERRAERGSRSRAIGLHAPVLAALEPSGITERLLAGAVRVDRGECRADGRVLGVVRFDALSTRFPFVATLPQPVTEAALAQDAPPVRRGALVTGIRTIAGDGRRRVRVQAVTADGAREWDAAVAIVASGAGGRDLVYRPGGVAIHAYADRYLMADADVDPRPDADVAVVTLARDGVLESFPLPEGRRRFVAWDGLGDDLDTGPETRDERLRAAMRRRGEVAAAERVTGATSFRVRRAVAPRLRRGPVLVVGDAAHEVSPIGGQGMNLGLLDAVGLAPLVATWVRTGAAPDAELERWERSRVRSARVAAAIASVNTALGRPRSPVLHRVRSSVLGAAISGPGGRLLAHAYAMGFDSGRHPTAAG